MFQKDNRTCAATSSQTKAERLNTPRAQKNINTVLALWPFRVNYPSIEPSPYGPRTRNT